MHAPPYCPNPQCAFHQYEAVSTAGVFWRHIGHYRTRVSGDVHRFSCRRCGFGFSERTTSIDYYTKRTLDYREILRATTAAESVSSIARHLGCSSDSIINRQARLGRDCLALHERIIAGHKLTEDLCADGFESFDRSQYFPNAINLLIGTESQFLYGTTHATMRRKGRMTDGQRRQRDQYDQIFPLPKGSLSIAFSSLIEMIGPMWNRSRHPVLVLRTDEHPTYRISLSRNPLIRESIAEGAFTHEVTSSKAPRGLTNPLFPVNYYDRELRKDIAAFRRESSCFSRNVSNGMMRLAHHLVWHNYMKPHRIVSRTDEPGSHAAVAGMDVNLINLELEHLFSDRAFLSQQKLCPETKKTWLNGHRTPLKKNPDFCPAFARAGLLQGSGN